MFSKAENIVMKLDGVRESADRKAVSGVLRSVDGVCRVSVRGDTVRVAFYPDRTTVPEMTECLAAAGYAVAK